MGYSFFIVTDRLFQSFLAHAGEALAAINGTIGLGLERHTGLAAAVGASGSEELTGATDRILTGVAAGLAALGLVLEATLSVEFLLAGSEHELVTAFLAHKSLVFKHCFYPLFLTICAFGALGICDQLSLDSPCSDSRAILRRMRCTALSTDFSGRSHFVAISE